MKIMGPAGSRDSFDAALAAGADEIYMGLRGYGARQSAANFSPDEFVRAIDDAHRLGTAVNLTLNTVMSEAEVEQVAPDLDRLAAAGLDAVIVQDFGVASWLMQNFPDLAVHASTQMALANRTEVAWAERVGFRRVVLPRELSFDEIESIRAGTGVELEVFASGALCLACSGKCYLSSFIGGRSGNRGSCAQPCRQSYEITSFESEEPKRKSGYLLSLADQLQEAEEIERLAKIGVGVIKIEGRMKSPIYVYEAVRWYRQMIDRLEGVPREFSRKMFALKADDENRPLITDEETSLPKIFHRGYGKGYVNEPDPPILHPSFASTFGWPIGEIENGVVRLSDAVRHGDGVVYVGENFQKLGGENVSRIEQLAKFSGQRPERVAEAAAGASVLLGGPPPEGAKYLFRTFDYVINKKIAHATENVRRHRPIAVRLTAKIGEPLQIELTADNVSRRALSDEPLEKSLKRKTDANGLREALDRFGETPFVPKSFDLDFDEDVFLPKSILNQTRQNASEALEKAIVESARRKLVHAGLFVRSAPRPTADSNRTPIQWAACVRTDAQAAAALLAGIKTVYRIVRPVLFEADRSAWEQWAHKNFTLEKGSASFAALAGNLAQAEWFEARSIPFAADGFFNVGNRRSAEFLFDRFAMLTTLYLSPELSRGAVERLTCALVPRVRQRGGRIGLSIYGRLAGMTTRKTLFLADKIGLKNQDGRLFDAVKNRTWYPDGNNLSGSTIYYGAVNHIAAQIEPLSDAGLGEARFDFTFESPEEIASLVERTRQGQTPNGDAYGFFHPIF